MSPSVRPLDVQSEHSPFKHSHADHVHAPTRPVALPASIMAASAGVRVGLALVGVAGLWLAVWWAAAQP